MNYVRIPEEIIQDVADALGYKEPHKSIQRYVGEVDRMKHPVTDSQNGNVVKTQTHLSMNPVFTLLSLAALEK